MKLIQGGTFMMGRTDKPERNLDKEYPQKQVTIDSFYIDQTPVTNLEFKHFVDETGYITNAEKYKASFVFFKSLTEQNLKEIQKVSGISWWCDVPNACWYSPEGFDSNLENRWDHPVVHVSRNDALAYCEWSNKRLPTEAEWELVARGGLVNQVYPWGNELMDNNEWQCNIWCGEVFPYDNSIPFGFVGTKPVKTYKPNGFDLYQKTGNVWEWCLNKKGIDISDFNNKELITNTLSQESRPGSEYALRGGSFLCHDSYCQRYKVYSRNGNTCESSSNNMSFRCAKNI